MTGDVGEERSRGAGPASTGASGVFDALADPTRRRVLALIGERGTASATELARELPVTRQAVNKHLANLAEAGLVAGEREGREVRFQLTPAPMSEALDWMTRVGARWDDRLAALRSHFETSSAPGSRPRG